MACEIIEVTFILEDPVIEKEFVQSDPIISVTFVQSNPIIEIVGIFEICIVAQTGFDYTFDFNID